MIYVLQFTEALGNRENPRGQARYYVGYCDDDRFHERMQEHQKGRGAAITRAAVQRGISFHPVLTLPGDRSEERRIKRMKNTPRFVQRHLRKQGLVAL